MKWRAIPFLLVAAPLFLFGVAADASGVIYDLSFIVGGTLLVVGVALLAFLPYAGSRTDQDRTKRQDRLGIVTIALVIALVIPTLIVWRIFV